MDPSGMVEEAPVAERPHHSQGQLPGSKGASGARNGPTRNTSRNQEQADHTLILKNQGSGMTSTTGCSSRSSETSPGKDGDGYQNKSFNFAGSKSEIKFKSKNKKSKKRFNQKAKTQKLKNQQNAENCLQKFVEILETKISNQIPQYVILRTKNKEKGKRSSYSKLAVPYRSKCQLRFVGELKKNLPVGLDFYRQKSLNRLSLMYEKVAKDKNWIKLLRIRTNKVIFFPQKGSFEPLLRERKTFFSAKIKENKKNGNCQPEPEDELVTKSLFLETLLQEFGFGGICHQENLDFFTQDNQVEELREGLLSALKTEKFNTINGCLVRFREEDGVSDLNEKGLKKFEDRVFFAVFEALATEERSKVRPVDKNSGSKMVIESKLPKFQPKKSEESQPSTKKPRRKKLAEKKLRKKRTKKSKKTGGKAEAEVKKKISKGKKPKNKNPSKKVKASLKSKPKSTGGSKKLQERKNKDELSKKESTETQSRPKLQDFDISPFISIGANCDIPLQTDSSDFDYITDYSEKSYR